jgi:uncharacterized membrane protein YjjB (DUF3815 family)
MVSTMQAWLLVGIPALVIGIVLYTARSRWLGALGLLVMLGATLVLATVDRVSAAALGSIAALLYATGRAGGGAAVGEDPVRTAARDATD